MLKQLKNWAHQLKRDSVALYFAARDPRTPLWLKLFAAVVAAYALSPVDLIPDFIPVLGLLDDLVLVPLGLWLALRALPAVVLTDARAQAQALLARPHGPRWMVALIVLLWVLGVLLLGWVLWVALKSA